MPAGSAQQGRAGGRLLAAVFWTGVGLAPLAALLVLLDDGASGLRIAAILAIVAVVLIGLSIVLRPDAGTVRVELEEALLDEIDQLRDDVRADITTAARATHRAIAERVQVLFDNVESVRSRMDGLRSAEVGGLGPAPGPRALGPGGVVRHTETVKVTRSTVVDQMHGTARYAERPDDYAMPTSAVPSHQASRAGRPADPVSGAGYQSDQPQHRSDRPGHRSEQPNYGVGRDERDSVRFAAGRGESVRFEADRESMRYAAERGESMRFEARSGRDRPADAGRGADRRADEGPRRRGASAGFDSAIRYEAGGSAWRSGMSDESSFGSSEQSRRGERGSGAGRGWDHRSDSVANDDSWAHRALRAAVEASRSGAYPVVDPPGAYSDRRTSGWRDTGDDAAVRESRWDESGGDDRWDSPDHHGDRSRHDERERWGGSDRSGRWTPPPRRPVVEGVATWTDDPPRGAGTSPSDLDSSRTRSRPPALPPAASAPGSWTDQLRRADHDSADRDSAGREPASREPAGRGRPHPDQASRDDSRRDRVAQNEARSEGGRPARSDEPRRSRGSGGPDEPRRPRAEGGPGNAGRREDNRWEREPTPRSGMPRLPRLNIDANDDRWG